MHDLAKDKPVEKSLNPFSTKDFALKRRDGFIRTLLRLATYFILACAGFIFADIIIKGAPVVFESFAPIPAPAAHSPPRSLSGGTST